jgi:adenine-specific DNA methylase
MGPEDLFDMSGFYEHPKTFFENFHDLDMTAGGGSIPFESLRLDATRL